MQQTKHLKDFAPKKSNLGHTLASPCTKRLLLKTPCLLASLVSCPLLSCLLTFLPPWSPDNPRATLRTCCTSSLWTCPRSTARKARGRKWKAPEEPQEQEASLPPAKEAREDTVIYMSTHGDRQWSEAMLSNLLYSQGRVESGNPPAPSCPCPLLLITSFPLKVLKFWKAQDLIS